MRLKTFFESTDRQQALWLDAKRWEGTPFFPNASERRVGVGCVNLVHELMFHAGACPRLEIPVYALDEGHHRPSGRLMKFLLTEPGLEGRLRFVPRSEELMPGDLMGLRSGHADHHLGVALKWGKMIHAHTRDGVQIVDQADRHVVDRLLWVMRFVEAEE